MILKVLLIIALITVVYYVFFKKKTTVENKNKGQINEMVECDTCHTYVELDEAILSHGKYYCCKECLK